MIYTELMMSYLWVTGNDLFMIYTKVVINYIQDMEWFPKLELGVGEKWGQE